MLISNHRTLSVRKCEPEFEGLEFVISNREVRKLNLEDVPSASVQLLFGQDEPNLRSISMPHQWVL